MAAQGSPRVVTAVLITATVVGLADVGLGQAYTIVDTGQTSSYDDLGDIMPTLSPGDRFYGQDAQYAGAQPAYRDNGDGTISDRVTGLMWQKTPGEPVTFHEAAVAAGSCRLAGHQDWRLPNVKELYSLINFNGNSRSRPPVPYIDTRYFDFHYGDTDAGRRFIDAQYWSCTQYVGTTMRGNATVFGVNFADGRIKGYPKDFGRSGQPMKQFVRYVRGGNGYGTNDFIDNQDGTITDRATGLMWTKSDSGKAMDWELALDYAEGLVVAGHDDWRLPNAKELQSIVDYSQAPDAQAPGRRGPAIDPVFAMTDAESWFWSSTTHLEGGIAQGSFAVYICFGQAFGLMGPPGHKNRLNVHGAGAQRSDPKSGNRRRPIWAQGFGPQGDEIRINNFVRCVRSASGLSRS